MAVNRLRGWILALLGGSKTRARNTAAALDRLVDAQLPLLPGLGPEARAHSAEYLAELVMLAQSYRQYANGWISRRELDRRGRQAVERLGSHRAARLPVAGVGEPD